MLPSKRVNTIKKYSNKMISLAYALYWITEFKLTFINDCGCAYLDLYDYGKITFKKCFQIPGYFIDKFRYRIVNHYKLYNDSSEIDDIYSYTRIQKERKRIL